jgi:hypothetical protein
MTELKVDLMNKNITPRHHRHASDIGKVNPENHFPITLMNILDDGGLSSIISWIPSSFGAHDDSRAFVITDRRKFARVVMPRFFKKGTKYPSFARRLKRWSFFHQSTSGSSSIYSHPMFAKGNRSLCLLMRPKPQVSYKKETKDPRRNPRNPQGLPGTTKRSTTVAVGNTTVAPVLGACGGISDDAPLLPNTGNSVPSSHGDRGGWSTTTMAEADYPLLNLPPNAYGASRLSSLASLSRQEAVDRTAAGMALLADTASVMNCSSAGEQRPSGALGNSSMLNIHELQQIQARRDSTCQESYSRLPFHPHASGTPTQPACDAGMLLRSRFGHHQGMHYGNNGNAPSIYFDSKSSSAPLAVNALPSSSNGSICCDDQVGRCRSSSLNGSIYCDDQVARCRSSSLAGATTYLPLVIGNATLAGILEHNLMERETDWHRHQRIANYDSFSRLRMGGGLSSWL